MLDGLGFSDPNELFARGFELATRDAPERQMRFLSLGCGNCDTEIRVAELLVERGVVEFELECLDINDAMLERGREAARSASLEDRILPRRADLNDWHTDHEYDAVMANQSLHHVVSLEGLFDEVERALLPDSRFVVSDMIGRNGHLRWPEALAVVREYWGELQPAHRYNHQLRRYEEAFEDWDCSREGFEGIRAQEILPLLIGRFDFELFVGFANAIDPFIGRAFGPNFDPANEWDQDFISRVHERDEAEIKAGTIKPTHMFATMRKRPFAGEMACRDHLTPRFCVRL